MPPAVSWVGDGDHDGAWGGRTQQWHRGDISHALAEVTAGSTGVVRALRQPAVIAAAGSLLWLALLALLLLLCQHHARQDALARHR